MVIILSESADFSTLEVIKWLKYFKIDYVRINRTDFLSIDEIDLNSDSIVLNIEGQKLNLSKVKSFWYRRGKFQFLGNKEDKFLSQIEADETYFLNTYIFSKLACKSNIIGNYLSSNINKISILEHAKSCGLLIPKTFLSGNRFEIEKFIAQNNGTIIKSIGVQIMGTKKGVIKMGYTENIKLEDLEEYTDILFPSLLQEKISKRYEIRSFFLDGSFYSMAIFSQLNPKTETDFRKYDDLNPNRTVPFLLPETIEGKLRMLFKKINLNTGSIDLILNTDGEYIFLEINPVGQFGMVSKPCNYFLERGLAQKLAYG